MIEELALLDAYTLGNPNGLHTWSDFQSIYAGPYYGFNKDLTIRESNQFINDYFIICEKEGFSSKYWTPGRNSRYNGMSYKVLERYWGLNFPAWLIEFDNGAKVLAYPENIIPHEMQALGCPYYTDYTTYR